MKETNHLRTLSLSFSPQLSFQDIISAQVNKNDMIDPLVNLEWLFSCISLYKSV